jgi:acyl-CoA synthetase (AMP-forming)/AMP-acid ligase II
MLGTWITMGIYVPLNPNALPAETGFILNCCDPRILFRTQDSPELLTGDLAQYAQRVTETTIEAKNIREAMPKLERSTKNDQIAMILFTSGTTGQPKGVALSFNNLLSNTASIADYLQITKSDVCLSVMPFHFSYGNSVLLSHLWAGAHIHVLRNAAFPSEIVQRLLDREISSLPGVPTMFRSLMGRVDLKDYEFPSLRYISIAGGALSEDELDELQLSFPNSNIFVMYGQTEATSRISYLAPEMREKKRGSVGLPLPGVEVLVRDEGDRQLAQGQIGEVCVRGPNVMAGYWEPDGLVNPPNGWLKTGDLGYQDDEGYLFLKGRRNEMIKTGGYRVFAKEIEDVLNLHDAVLESAVVKMKDKLLGEVPVGFVVCNEKDTATIRNLMRHCKERLEAPKVPKKIVIVGELPKTTSGKIKKAALQPD